MDEGFPFTNWDSKVPGAILVSLLHLVASQETLREHCLAFLAQHPRPATQADLHRYVGRPNSPLMTRWLVTSVCCEGDVGDGLGPFFL